jgi:2-polyprenyl-3-methyl-5-hydroxy-6-metoxy-1,4-benzoquinol methylase
MKKIIIYIANLLSFIWKIIPEKLRLFFLFSLLLIESRSAYNSKEDSLRNIFFLKDKITWIINERAMAFHNGVHPKHKLTNYHSFFIDNIKNGEDIIDIGCGYGEVARSIALTNPKSKVLGIDFDYVKINQARKLGSLENLFFISGDIYSLKSNLNFNTIILSNVIEHIHNRVKFIKDICMLLKPRRILIRIPAFERSWEVKYRKQLKIQYFLDSDHKIEHTLKEIKEELYIANIKIKKIIPKWGEYWIICCPRR